MNKKKAIQSHRELDVYQIAFDAAMRIFEISKGFPIEERYSLTDQIRRSSRSVCANLAEAWRKRRYEGAFIAKLSDSEQEARGQGCRGAGGKEEREKGALRCRGKELVCGASIPPFSLPPSALPLPPLLPCTPAPLPLLEAEAAETQTWIEFAVKCNYLEVEAGRELYQTYNQVLGKLVSMINNPSPWLMSTAREGK
jgi:hypothetical protein